MTVVEVIYFLFLVQLICLIINIVLPDDDTGLSILDDVSPRRRKSHKDDD